MQEFEFPTNIKQVGSISGKIKIYVEDYVCTYLQQYADSQGYKECLAVLLGRQMVIDGQKILFISGAVQGKYLNEQEGIETFTEESWKYVDEEKAAYFADLEILGCMQSQPGYGVYLNVNYGKYFREIFSKTYHVFFILDPIERTNAFFTFDKEKKEISEAKGYFVYYDRNESMHEYMLNNKVVRDKVGEIEEEEEEEIKILSTRNTDREIREKANPVRIAKKSGVQRRLVNMLVSVSAVLLVICFVMGVGLMQNEDRIARLEKDLENINISYAAIMDTLKNGSTEAVFAEQLDEREEINESLPTENPAPLISENGSELVGESLPQATAAPTALPSAAPETAFFTPVEIPPTYTVEDGDNLLYISLKFYGSTDMVARIMEYNGLSDPDKIFFGKTIKLPPSE